MANQHHRLLFVVLSPLLIFGALFIALLADLAADRFVESEINLAEQLLSRTERSVEPFLAPLDPISLQVVMDDFHQALPEAAISLMDTEGQVVVAAGEPEANSMVLSRPLIIGGKNRGRLVSHLPRSASESVKDAIYSSGILLVIFFALSLVGLTLYLGDFLMLWLGFPKGNRRTALSTAPSPEPVIRVEEDADSLIHATLHFSPARLLRESALRASLSFPPEALRRVSEGTFELTLTSTTPGEAIRAFFNALDAFLKENSAVQLRGALLLDAVVHERELRKKSRFYASLAKDHFIIDDTTLEELLHGGFVEAGMVQPFASSLVADEQLFVYRFD